MAFTPLLFEGFETGGLERASSVTGPPTVGTNVRAAANGQYSLTSAAGVTQYAQYQPYEYQGTPNNNAKVFGFWFNAAGMDGNTVIGSVLGTDLVWKIRVWVLPNDQLYVADAGGSIWTSSTGFLTGWHFIEIWYEDNSASAAVEIWVDGSNVSSQTNRNLQATQTKEITVGHVSTSGTVPSYIDDLYFGEATTDADLLGGMDIFATVGDGSATTGGDTLDAGSWANVQEIPKNDTNLASYNAGAGGNTDEREAPDTLAVQTNLTGSVTDIDDDPDSPDGLWLTASGSSTARVTFPTPTGSPTVGAGLQNFRVLLRKNATGPSGGGGQNLAPDGSVFTLTNLSGVFGDVGEDPDSPDANWLTAPGNNNNTDVRASFGTPTTAPTGTQTFRAWVRKTNHSTNPTAVVELYETGGALLATVVASTTITSITGQMLTGTFAASLLGTADGSAVEMRIAGTVGGGNPSNRASVEVGTMQWQEAYALPETQPGYEVRLYENGTVVAAVAAATGNLTDAGGNTIVQLAWDATNLGTADGSLVECYVNQTSGADRYIEVGAVEWNCKYPTPGPAESGWVEANSGVNEGPLNFEARKYYYFDASDDAATGTNWTNGGSSGFNGDPSSLTSIVEPNVGVVHGGGTSAPTTGGTVSQVRARWKYWVQAAYTSLTAEWFTDGKAESLGSHVGTPPASTTSSWITLSVPTGGWTWAKIAALEVEITPIFGSAVDVDKCRFFQSDIEVTAAPATALNEIVGLTTYARTQYSGSGSTLTHSLYRGNDVDGVTELTLGAATAALADFFDITQSAAIMPLITEQTRVGFGHPVSVDVDIDATEIIGMVAHLPLVVTGRDVTTIPEVIAVTENDASVVTNVPRVVGCTSEAIAVTENDAAVNASRNVTQEAYVTEAHDTFTDPNGTLLSAHTPDAGNSWYGGLPNAYATEIQNNRVVGVGGSFDEWLVEVPNSEDCVITADLQQGPDYLSGVNVLFRSIHNTDSLDHWMLSFLTTPGIELRRSSTTVGLATWTNSILGSNVNKLRQARIVLKGSSIKVYVDGVKLFDVTDSEHSSGIWHGFRLFNNNGNWIDNFLVQSGDEARTGVSENLATINRERGVTCTPETIAVTENDATVIRGAAAVPRDVTCTPEIIAVTENDSTINRERGVTSIPEVIAVTENDAQVNSGRSIATIPESVAVTENDSTIQTDRGVTSVPEVILVTENDSTIQTARGVATDPEVILVTENTATINSTRIVFSIPEPILVTENDSTINRSRGVTSIPEIILVTEPDATISTNVALIVACTPEVVLVTESDSTINRARGVTTDPEVILVIEPDATVISGANLDVTCTTEIILVTEPDATISTNVPLIVACTSEVVLVTEPDATIQTDRGVTGIPEVILITESDATISTARTVAGISESILVTENDSTIKIDRGVTTLPEVVLVTEPDATIVTGKLISCIPELIALYENDSTINRERGVLTLPELIAIFENNATVIRGGAVTRRVMIVT